MHVCAAIEITSKLLPALTRLRDQFASGAEKYAHIVKIGRTHLQVSDSGTF
jgi:fumarate hydratase class II